MKRVLLFSIVGIFVTFGIISCKSDGSKSDVSGIEMASASGSTNYWAEFIPKNCQFDRDYINNLKSIKMYKDSNTYYKFLVLPETCKDPTKLSPSDSDHSTTPLIIKDLLNVHVTHINRWCKNTVSSSRYEDCVSTLNSHLLNNNITDEALSFFKRNKGRWLLIEKGEKGLVTYSSKDLSPQSLDDINPLYSLQLAFFASSSDIDSNFIKHIHVNPDHNYFAISFLDLTNISNSREVINGKLIDNPFKTMRPRTVIYNYQVQK